MRSPVCVVVPAYNEAAALGAALRPLLDAGYAVIVVDDASSDSTPEILAALPVAHLRHPVNLGQGAALQTGVDYALDHGAEFVVHFDADGQHRAADIEALLAPLRASDADVAIGSRFLRREDSEAVPWSRRWLLRGAIVVNGLLTGVWLSDAHNGLRAFHRAAAQAVRIRENRFAHASEILLAIRRAGLRVVERPTHIDYSEYSRAKGQSSLGAVDVLVDLVLRRLFG